MTKMVPAPDAEARPWWEVPAMTDLTMRAPAEPADWAARAAVAAPLLSVFAIGVGAPLYADDLSEAAATGRFVLANAASLAVLVLLAFALVALHRRHRVGDAGFVLALTGTILAAGGTWDQVFAVPHLAEEAPSVLDAGASGSLLAGYLISYMALATGWATFAVALLRARVVARAGAIVLLCGAVFAILPAPTAIRLLPLAIGVALVTRPAPRDRGRA
jgi:hypothetical protein